MQKLEIINAMLQSIGEQPVLSAESQHPSVLSASAKVDMVNYQMQAHGWWFNTSLGVRLSPSPTGEILLPGDTISVRPKIEVPYVQRGSRLFNTSTASYVIGSAVDADLIQLVPIEDLPVAAALALKAHSVHSFYVDDDGDLDKAQVYEREYMRAMVLLRQEQLRAAPVNANDSAAASRMQMKNKVVAGFGTRLSGGVYAR